MLSSSEIAAHNAGHTPAGGEPDNTLVEQHAARLRKLEWLRNPQTVELFGALQQAIEELDTQAKNLAMGDEVQSAPHVRALLIKSRTLESVIKYGRDTDRTTDRFSIA